MIHLLNGIIELKAQLSDSFETSEYCYFSLIKEIYSIVSDVTCWDSHIKSYNVIKEMQLLQCP